jgi:hypothetical protein
MSTSRVHVIVTCTSRKRIPVPPRTQMRKVTAKTLPKRMEDWIDRLVNASGAAVGADDLYCGGHWDVVRRMRTTAKVPILTWVASAGYGLIPISAPLAPYAATFDSRHPDTVTHASADAASWWRLLGEWEGPAAGTPRSVTSLVASAPEARYLLVLSEPYLRACLPDVQQAIAHLPHRDQLSIICGGARPFAVLRPWLIPCDARLQSALGGAMQSLNVRLAAHLLSNGATGHKAMSQRARRLLAAQPPLPRHARQQLSDAQIMHFIRTLLREDPRLTATRALRALRDAGFACEQGRFAAIFSAQAAGAA